MSRHFAIVDVFARQRYAGNQLAVVTDAGDMDSGEMQSIAAEFGFSETTFVTGEPEDGAWPVRIFTPTEEVPFAGHPTLGTAAVIRREVAADSPDEVVLDLAAGAIPVDRRDGTLWMRQNPSTFGEELPPAPVADALGLGLDDLDDEHPVSVVSTGLPTIIVPLTGRDALEAIDLDRAAYDALVADRDAKLLHAFCAEPRDQAHDLAARMFAPALGVSEDPATGSANGCLAAYLSREAYLGSRDVDVTVEQGYELGRPSLLHLRAWPAGATTGDDLAVEVGGSVVPVATGELA